MQSDPYDGVYRATYSGVPVYEILIQGHPIMRRQSDSYMNATQILKVAGIEKGRRTKILEREILIGEHEKIQGGYGKYQGTWIPFDTGKELAERYDVYHLLKTLLEFQPPACETDIPRKDEVFKGSGKQHATSSNSNNNNTSSSSQQKHQQRSPPPSPSTSSIADSPHPSKRPRISHENDRSALMALFLGDDSSTFPDLVDIDIDLVIDDQGHTALHWAASLARIQTLEALIARGADPARVNYAGETALMRSVMMNNCYDTDCFPKLLTILHDTIHLTDYYRRNIFHHTVVASAIDKHQHVALYYMKHLFDTVKASPSITITPITNSSSSSSSQNSTASIPNLQSLVDMQDSNGETPFNIANRLGAKELADMLAEFNHMDAISSPPSPSQSLPRIETTYAPNPRGKEIVSTVQKLVDALDEDYTTQLRERDEELQRTQQKLWAVTLQLNEAQRKLEEHEKQQQRLDDNNNTDDLLNEADNSIQPNDNDPRTREQWLEERIRILQRQINTQSKSQEDLSVRYDSLQTQTSEREQQCKRLIAACCNLPLERIDTLLEPLLAAVESDPPDLEFGQVVSFMEQLRQNSNNKSSPLA
ncbi:apses-domain-containing protein [Lichtheimia hyalospora FSU 10163]|nr:apses-domain-containing protein [Lichtheimia hyalospora FSU 10163]